MAKELDGMKYLAFLVFTIIMIAVFHYSRLYVAAHPLDFPLWLRDSIIWIVSAIWASVTLYALSRL